MAGHFEQSVAADARFDRFRSRLRPAIEPSQRRRGGSPIRVDKDRAFANAGHGKACDRRAARQRSGDLAKATLDASEKLVRVMIGRRRRRGCGSALAGSCWRGARRRRRRRERGSTVFRRPRRREWEIGSSSAAAILRARRPSRRRSKDAARRQFFSRDGPFCNPLASSGAAPCRKRQRRPPRKATAQRFAPAHRRQRDNRRADAADAGAQEPVGRL